MRLQSAFTCSSSTFCSLGPSFGQRPAFSQKGFSRRHILLERWNLGYSIVHASQDSSGALKFKLVEENPLDRKKKQLKKNKDDELDNAKSGTLKKTKINDGVKAQRQVVAETDAGKGKTPVAAAAGKDKVAAAAATTAEEEIIDVASEKVSEKVSKPKSKAERYLEVLRERKEAAAAAAAAEGRVRREKRKDKPVKLKSFDPCCYGCGALLHYSDENAPGYVPEKTYLLKQKHKHLNKVLCTRCQQLSHGKMVPAVGGYGGYGREKGFVTAEELRTQLAHIRDEKALIVKLVDIVDFSGSFMTRIRDLVGSNPIILVITKVDLLPEETKMEAVGDWIIETTLQKKLNVTSVHLTSSKSLAGVPGVVREILRQRQGRDVYILGAANVGKSAFISVMLQEMATRDFLAAAARRYRPVQSALPGTTLGPIEIKAFSGGGNLYDTPGLHLHHRIESAVYPEDLPLLAPKRRLRGYVVSSVRESKADEDEEESESQEQNLAGMSLFWGGIARIDIPKNAPKIKLTFYGATALRIHKVATSEADNLYKEEVGKSLVPPTDKQKAASDWPGLQRRHEFGLDFERKRPVGDIAVSGLGWVSVELVGEEEEEEEDLVEGEEKKKKRKIEIGVQCPKGIEVFLRRSLPVGKYGATWYKFKEVTEDLLKCRPILHFTN